MHKYWFWRFLFNNHYILTWLSLFFITVYPIQSQTGNISGRVETTTKGTLLRGADILLIGTDIGGSTDSSGIYMIANILPGTYSLRALYIGYAQTTITDIKVYPGQTTNINFILGKEVLKGEEVTIIAAVSYTHLTLPTKRIV